jgi:hypothetical protein
LSSPPVIGLDDVALAGHMPKTRRRKVPGMTLPRGFGVSAVGGGGGARSNNGKNILFVFGSSAMLRAPGAVFTVSRTLYLSGDSCRMTETVPSP